jgi:fumarylacetoacetate (FAA) hydrolase family protein
MLNQLTTSICLPQDADRATLVARVWLEGAGPVLVTVRPDGVYELGAAASTMSELLELDQPVAAVRQHTGRRLGDTAAILKNSAQDERKTTLPWFLAPCDLQCLKATGVTFVNSVLERVIEEQARGDAAKAESVRQAVVAVIGDNLSSVKPASAEAVKLKEVLLAQGAWSQYLEVAIGPDAEVFTKSQPMSAVGVGAEVGIHPRSHWNNPEPEIVLAVNSRAQTVGATLGNDVNLRDFEGRSALLLGKAKDNNASCGIGPFIRLFDEHFGIDDVRHCELKMQVIGADGFVMHGSSSMSQISRDPLELVKHVIGAHHQYPDGLMFFLGTMFAPTQDRHGPGQGFTHVVGDVVTVSTPSLGTLVNRVNTCDQIAPWTYGTRALMRDLARRGVLTHD